MSELIHSVYVYLSFLLIGTVIGLLWGYNIGRAHDYLAELHRWLCKRSGVRK